MIVELVLILILFALAGRGWRIGLVESLGELVGAAVAFMVARWGSALFGVTGVTRFIAFVVIALIVAKLVGLLFHIASKILKIVTSLPFIHLATNFLGGVLGFLTGIILIGSTTYIVLFYRLDPTLMGWLGGSHVAQWCQWVFSSSLRFLL
jgi:hypothetical protein